LYDRAKWWFKNVIGNAGIRFVWFAYRPDPAAGVVAKGI
jgi:hypothetical protein